MNTLHQEQDFLSQFLAPAEAISKEITYNGQKGTAFFKRISAGQRAALLKGQRITRRGDESASFDIDLGDNVIGKHRLVLFSCCFADGKARFKSLSEVQAAESNLIEVLYNAASEVNKEDGEDSPEKS